MGIAEIIFEQPVGLLRDYRGFHYCVSRNFFAYHPATAVDWTLPAQSRLQTQSAKKIQ